MSETDDHMLGQHLVDLRNEERRARQRGLTDWADGWYEAYEDELAALADMREDTE